MKKGEKDNFIKAVFSFISISILVIAISFYFMFNNKILGLAFIGMGIFTLGLIKLLGIKLKFIYPDLTFGFVDNGVMVFAVIFGGSMGGVAGAIIGGAAGTTLTDGLGGLFEGYVSERETALIRFKSERGMLSSSLGKMAGCLFGAGLGLMLAGLIGLI